MGDDNIIHLDIKPGDIAKIRNLKPYRGKSDEEIAEILRNRKPREKREVSVPEVPNINQYDIKFNEKMKILQTEFGVDMNDSNDSEALKNLVRLQIQLEKAVTAIHLLQETDDLDKDEVVRLKNLGDFQRATMTSISDLQGQLGISRKQRKEKAVDDIPQWVDRVLEKAKTTFDRKTIKVDCPKCQVELGRFWLNFPHEDNDIQLSLTCWKCKERIEYIG
jgi:hypothetical protein